MYGQAGASSYDAAHANSNESTMKKLLDNWYKENIVNKGYSDKVADTIYCNNRSLYSGYGYNTLSAQYTSIYKINFTKNPELTCANKNDRFTVSDTNKGNGALTYPIGLITADEMSYAGGKWDTINTNYYLYTGQIYWTMTPSNFNTNSVYIDVFISDYRGDIDHAGAGNVYAVRPVLSLKSSVELQGSGTMTDPFIVQD